VGIVSEHFQGQCGNQDFSGGEVVVQTIPYTESAWLI
jgi:hypothetical protein